MRRKDTLALPPGARSRPKVLAQLPIPVHPARGSPRANTARHQWWVIVPCPLRASGGTQEACGSDWSRVELRIPDRSAALRSGKKAGCHEGVHVGRVRGLLVVGPCPARVR